MVRRRQAADSPRRRPSKCLARTGVRRARSWCAFTFPGCGENDLICRRGRAIVPICVRAADRQASVGPMTEDDARLAAQAVLADRFPAFSNGDWVIFTVEEYDTAWAVSYNGRQYVESGDIRDALGGNGALVVPKSGVRAMVHMVRGHYGEPSLRLVARPCAANP
jgi:hypothetical protein